MAHPTIDQAFADRPALHRHIASFISQSRRTSTDKHAADAIAIFEEIALYVQELKDEASGGGSKQDEPASKKRRLDIAGNGVNGTGAAAAAATPASNGAAAAANDVLTANWQASTVDVSFSVPQRKKLSLQVSADRAQGIRALNPATKQAEFGIPWRSIEHVLRLPVPEKAQASHNFCVFPKGADGLPGAGGDGAGAASYETMVWGAADAKKRNEEDKPTESDTLLQTLKAAGARVIEPDEKEFVSVHPHPMRKTEKQYHVKAFRGNKEGYLFFLPTGIAFVFKKPLLFFSFASIISVSYTSVLQRTFNLNISAIPSGAAAAADAEPVELEFSMLDQADYPGIDAYIKQHSLQDASMAEARRAKIYNVNKDEPGEGGAGGAGGESELQKAHQEAEQIADDDDDEEDDENFDPGSEGESEGEGDSTDDEEEGRRGDAGNGDEMDTDLVEKELGSEAEDVELDDEEDEDE